MKKKMVTSWNLEKDKPQVQTEVELIPHCLGKGVESRSYGVQDTNWQAYPSDPNPIPSHALKYYTQRAAFLIYYYSIS